MSTPILASTDQRTIDRNYDLTRERLLQRRFLAKVDAYRAYDQGELRTHPLIVDIANHDVTYWASDDNAVYRSGKLREEELRKAIEVSPDFSSREKALLAKGLHNGQYGEFSEAFPYALIHSTLAPEKRDTLITEYLNEGFDEKRWLCVQALLNKLEKPMNRMTLPRYGDNIVYTKGAPNPRMLTGKISVSEELQTAVLELETKLSKDSLKYYLRWYREVVSCGAVPRNTDWVYSLITNTEIKVDAQLRDVYLEVPADKGSSIKTKDVLRLSVGAFPNCFSIQLVLNQIN